MLLFKIKHTLEEKLKEYEIDDWNEFTYEYSRGYRKCLMDIVNYINNIWFFRFIKLIENINKKY